MPVSVQVQNGTALGARPRALTGAPALRRLMGRAARATLRHARQTDAELSVTLLGDDEIAALNAEFLAHDGPTDVISFPLYDAGERVVGDVYVGWQQAQRQAATNDVPLAEELVRLTVHGVLHVLGHDHPDGAARLRSEMWLLQETIVSEVCCTASR
jgi:probable rRNA maturation factor